MSFDPNQFLDQSFDQANSTETIPVPAGEYMGISEKVEIKSWTAKKDPSKSGLTLEVTWLIDDAAVKEALNRDEVRVRQGIMLDLTESGMLDMSRGMNVGLGRLREALGLNVPGQPFSFNMIPGRAAKVAVKHRVVDDTIYAEVRGVTKL